MIMDRQGYWSSLVIPIVRALERIAIALEAQKPKEKG